MSGYIPELNPIGPGQLATSPSYPDTLPLNRYFQYGTSMPSSGFDWTSLIAPIGGSIVGAGLNMLGTAYQNYKQAQFYDKYMSPSARMAQMRAAGINPNAAAQGISGAPAPQMNAAAPTGAFTGIGEQLGQSVNSALTAENIAAQTKNLEVQNEGQELQNRMAEVELGIKPDMLSAELDDLRQSANQRRQAVEESKENVRKAEQEIKNLKAEESYTKTKEGLIEYEKRLDEANTRLANANAALSKAEKELTDINKQIAEMDKENYLTPEERIKMPIEAEYDVDPIRADFRTQYKAIHTLDAQIEQLINSQAQFSKDYANNKYPNMSKDEYYFKDKEFTTLIAECRASKKDAENAFENRAYQNGYHTWWQDNATSLIGDATRLISSVIIRNVGRNKAGDVKLTNPTQGDVQRVNADYRNSQNHVGFAR